MRSLALLLLVLAPWAASAQTDAEVDAVVGLQQIYAANLMGQRENADLDRLIAATGAPEPVAAFFRDGLRGAPVLAREHLVLPDRETLAMIVAVDSVHQTSFDEPRPDPADVARASLAASHDLHQLAHQYYQILFTFVGNKVRPFDLSGYDFEPLAYTDGDAELAAIFYLEAMRMSQKQIWGLLNIANPPNFSGAAEMIAGYPTFDGRPYYAFTALDPGDFSAYIGGDYTPYRAYYINDLYATLLYHLRVMSETGGSREAMVALVSESAISTPEYYPYCEAPAVLASLAAQAASVRD